MLEALVESLSADVAAPDFGTRPHTEMTAKLDELSEAQTALDAAMERWMELEAMTE